MSKAQIIAILSYKDWKYDKSAENVMAYVLQSAAGEHVLPAAVLAPLHGIDRMQAYLQMERP